MGTKNSGIDRMALYQLPVGGSLNLPPFVGVMIDRENGPNALFGHDVTDVIQLRVPDEILLNRLREGVKAVADYHFTWLAGFMWPSFTQIERTRSGWRIDFDVRELENSQKTA